MNISTRINRKVNL